MHHFVSTVEAGKALENRGLIPSVCLTIFTTIYTDGYNWTTPSNVGGHLPAFSRNQHPVDNCTGSYLVPQQVICISTRNPHAEKEERQIVLLLHIPHLLSTSPTFQPVATTPIVLGEQLLYTFRSHLFRSATAPTPQRLENSGCQQHGVSWNILENIHMGFCRRAPRLDYFYSTLLG